MLALLRWKGGYRMILFIIMSQSSGSVAVARLTVENRVYQQALQCHRRDCIAAFSIRLCASSSPFAK
uniref:Uncharacterized protein n=2 Tax=Anguilla anguilla TaxID=7936 RepID=A0A0E9TBG6_ANGAN